MLEHQPDRAAFLRDAADRVRPGGVVVFLEPDLPEPDLPQIATGYAWSRPPVPLFDQVQDLIVAAITFAGGRVSTGGELVRLFHEAGLTEPELLYDKPVGGAGSQIIEWVCMTFAALRPLLEGHGVDVANYSDPNLPSRIREVAAANHSQFSGANMVGAWANPAGPPAGTNR